MFPFNAINNDNYYRLSMNSRYGFTRLEKRNGATFSTLAVNARGYVDGNQLEITVEVNVNTIVVYI